MSNQNQNQALLVMELQNDVTPYLRDNLEEVFDRYQTAINAAMTKE
jgi:hypothetical protein